MKPFDLSTLSHHLGRWLITCLSAVLLFLSGIQPVAALTQTAAETTSLSSESFVAAAVHRVGDAVVRIDTERTITRNVPDLFYDDPVFRGFFGPDTFQRIPQEERLSGQGSGFIVDSNGYILTNAHVVDQADRVTVTLKDGRHFDGTVEGVDELTDLAVVKINADKENLPVVALGDSDTIDVGDWAIAVGNPLGLDNTVTLGIVSTLKRSSATVGIPNKRLDFIQTDAAINPGNSGGPLLNSQGEVIGINTAIRADAMGIGFAIPINKAKSVQDQLARGEHIAHPYLGIQIADLTPEMAKRNNDDPNASMLIPEISGVLVIRVLPDTPAAKAGLRRGDVITQINDQNFNTANQLQSYVDQSKIGQRLKLSLRRGDQTQTIVVKSAELDPDA
ncbi:trypsin-like peptidase domain-containing protein [Leptolyngbya cf. ectocarpi LEGE 11479]|uniref:Trypsin-like peptidase domain-containing protein n=1 Tax=Leptolyngbya cf. ectocarpi LEGE 11479 TaxID=1828722 RepID=A0A929F8C0_LEPEC|nr:HhoA/HhoB/HtrA family serine endopeptidase [Leptolyngbya ectocarpi]MBE9068736.1 trypsin-like peptidase domain-containing protein [Leptolyngbya cf. ectocarpi LEGE 11479]